MLVHEPKRPPQRLLLPGGEPIVQTDPLPGSDPLGVEFEDGITLEASRIAVSDRHPMGPCSTSSLTGGSLTLLRRGSASSSTSTPDKGDTVNVDHVALATVAPFEAFPVNIMTLRDVLPGIAVEGGKTYKIYVGVWRARRGGQRLKVITPGTLPVDENRLLVATIHTP